MLNGSTDVSLETDGHVVNILMLAAEMMRVLMAKLRFSSVVELIGHAEVSNEEFVSSDGSLLHMPSTCPWCLSCNVKLSLVGHLTILSMCMSDDPWCFSCIREVVIGETSGDSFCVDGLLLVFWHSTSCHYDVRWLYCFVS